MAKHNLHIEFANEIGTYAINVGSVFNDEYGEKLDSASVIISKIDRKLNIKPNDEVYIFDKNNINEFERYYLIDSVYCKEITLNNNKMYQYTIELKSLTGYLDLVQLPNRTINHSLVKGQKLIIDYIEQFVELYVPKIKMKIDNKWKYSPLFDINLLLEENGISFVERFSVPCMDLSFSQPTLRQALTSLMLQVGCLPKIVKSKTSGINYLSCLDLRAKPKTFNDIDKSQNYTTYSYASDSYVNTLVNMNDNVLDDDNVVITETIGFRDTNNVLLKQKENLKLNTIYPIYSVEKLEIKVPIRADVKLSTKTPFGVNGYLTPNAENTGLLLFGSTFWETVESINFDTTYTKVYAYDLTQDGDINTTYKATYDITQATLTQDRNEIVLYADIQPTYLFVLEGRILRAELKDGTIIENKEVLFTSASGANEVIIGTYYYYFDRDITQLCVERNKRNLLNTNFREMQTKYDLNEISQYLYGTVGYDIGGKVIDGFSSTYSVAEGWWNKDLTYIENMYERIMFVDNYLTDNVSKQIKAELGLPDRVKLYATGYTAVKHENDQLFTTLLFSIYYKPLNTFRLNNIKEEDAEFRMEQLDTSENAISNFNEITKVEQQKVNRLGNEVVVKNQRTEYLSSINEINTKFDDYIVFSRTIAVGFEDYKVNYTASKNYVLQNYFTAIQTKYRAYEYISYGQSVVRKENTTVYARIGRDYYDGDDYIYFGNKTDTNNKHLEHVFLSGAVNKYDNSYLYTCAANGDDFGITLYKTDLSIMVSNNIVAFATQDFDSVSYGIALQTEHEDIGGLPQTWIIKGENSGYDKFSYVLLNNDGSAINNIQTTKDSLLNVMEQSFRIPLVSNPNYEHAMSLVDNNKTDAYTNLAKTYYLDKQEVLNQTTQFVFYTYDDGIKWTEKLLKMSWFICNKEPKGKKYFYIPSEEEAFNINNEVYNSIDVSKLKPMSFDSYELDFEGNALRIRWANIGSNLKWTKVIYKEDNKYYDLLAVKRLGNAASENIYITLNDTRTDKVAYIKNGLISFNEYEVVKNTLIRNVKKL